MKRVFEFSANCVPDRLQFLSSTRRVMNALSDDTLKQVFAFLNSYRAKRPVAVTCVRFRILLKDTVAWSSWHRWVGAWLALRMQHECGGRDLRPPYTEAELQRAETKYGVDLPHAFRCYLKYVSREFRTHFGWSIISLRTLQVFGGAFAANDLKKIPCPLHQHRGRRREKRRCVHCVAPFNGMARFASNYYIVLRGEQRGSVWTGNNYYFQKPNLVKQATSFLEFIKPKADAKVWKGNTTARYGDFVMTATWHRWL